MSKDKEEEEEEESLWRRKRRGAMHVVLHKYAALHKSLRTRYRCSGIVQIKKKRMHAFLDPFVLFKE